MSIYDRYINNNILLSCRRPQPYKECSVVTIGEIIEILIKKYISNTDIIKLLKLDHNKIIGGQYGTDTIISGITILSDNAIKSHILHVQDLESDWNMIKQCIKNGVLYYHSPGHHSLCGGFIEEPLIDKNKIWSHENIDKNNYNNKRCNLLQIEHLIKKQEHIDQGMIISQNFRDIIKILSKHSNTNLVYFYC